jgi:lipoate-protein ligase A
MTSITPRAADAIIRCWIDDPAPGDVNMAADEWLAGFAVGTGLPVVRFSCWSAATLSLGAFQESAAVPAGLAELPLVRRPSGGGAILHGTDLTCTVAVPRVHAWGGEAQRLYDEVHRALVAVLGAAGVEAALHPGPDGPQDVAAEPDAYLCFDRRARGDMVMPDGGGNWAKVLGSAQRRHRAAVVQHGSLLWTTNPAGGAHAHRGLAELAAAQGRRLDREMVRDRWLAAITQASGLSLALQQGCTWDMDGSGIAAIATRFRDPAWIHRR